MTDLTFWDWLKTVVSIPLRNKAGIVVAFTLVDKSRSEEVLKYTWHLNDQGYVKGKVNGIPTLLHVFLIGKVEGKVVDHINHVRDDNRMANIRHVDRSMNNQNATKSALASSQLRGVRWDKGKWTACFAGIIIGRFDEEMDAALHYDRHMFTHHPDALKNFAPEKSQHIVLRIPQKRRSPVSPNVRKLFGGYRARINHKYIAPRRTTLRTSTNFVLPNSELPKSRKRNTAPPRSPETKMGFRT
jgi:hypothetical protein